MAKKQKDEAPDPRSVTNRDILQRLNFLYQATVYLQGLPSTNSAPSNWLEHGEAIEKEPKRKRKTTIDLSRTYVEMMKVVGKKAVVRMDPGIKRTICKGCSVIFIPGHTAKVRTKSSKPHRRIVRHTCMTCGTSRRIPAASFYDTAEDTAVGQTSEYPTAQSGTTTSLHRAPPLSSQPDTGHVVFCGNEKLVIDDQKGNGTFVA